MCFKQLKVRQVIEVVHEVLESVFDPIARLFQCGTYE